MEPMISLLKGVNVGGHGKIKMDLLRDLYTGIGLKDPRTYIQSGNVVFLAKEKHRDHIARQISDAIEHACGFRPEVAVRTLPEMQGIVARYPFAGREPAKVAVLFLTGEPVAPETLVVKPCKEEWKLDGQEMFVYFPDGMGKTKFSVPSLEKSLKTFATARNWNTVLKLVEMACELA